MLTFGWGEILLVFIVVIVVVGPKDIPKLIKQLSSFVKSIKKLSREFKSSLNEIADQEEFKEINKTIMEAKNIKDDFKYSDALSNSGIVWDYQYLDLWLENPQSLIPENKMVYVGMRKKRDREDLIAYLLIETQQ